MFQPLREVFAALLLSNLFKLSKRQFQDSFQLVVHVGSVRSRLKTV